MTLQSYLQNEVSSDPGGLTHRWLIKAMLVVAFVLLILQALSEVLKAYHRLENKMALVKTACRLWLLWGPLVYMWLGLTVVAFWFDPVFLMFGMALGFTLALGFKWHLSLQAWLCFLRS